jgi:membrane protease YdiL (CAAX protease family)
MGSFMDRFRTVVLSGIVAFLILAVGQGIWGPMAFLNLKTTPAIPWSVLIMAPLLWLLWQYLGGKGWPRSTSEARRNYLRATPVSGRVFAWVFVAGVLSVVALTGYWIVMFQLFKMPGNLVPDMSKYPLWTLVALLLMGSLAAPLSEEAAFRGYAQGMLERKFSAPVAIVISSVMFALAHLTQGFLFPKLFVYFLAGVAIGVPAYLTKSILPGIAVHIVADLTFFTLVWPHDTTRRLVAEGGADAWFWIHVAQAVIFTGVAILASVRLARSVRSSGGPVVSGIEHAAFQCC